MADRNRKDDEAGPGSEGNGLAALKALLMARVAAVAADDLSASRYAGRTRRPGQAATEAGKGTPRYAGSTSEERTDELQSPMRISYAVFCLTTQIKNTPQSNEDDG